MSAQMMGYVMNGSYDISRSPNTVTISNQNGKEVIVINSDGTLIVKNQPDFAAEDFMRAVGHYIDTTRVNERIINQQMHSEFLKILNNIKTMNKEQIVEYISTLEELSGRKLTWSILNDKELR